MRLLCGYPSTESGGDNTVLMELITKMEMKLCFKTQTKQARQLCVVERQAGEEGQRAGLLL